VYEVGRVFPKHVQRTCLTGESPLGRPRVAYTLQLYNYLLRFLPNNTPPPLKGLSPILYILKL
jgi:hypothetical protein